MNERTNDRPTSTLAQRKREWERERKRLNLCVFGVLSLSLSLWIWMIVFDDRMNSKYRWKQNIKMKFNVISIPLFYAMNWSPIIFESIKLQKQWTSTVSSSIRKGVICRSYIHRTPLNYVWSSCDRKVTPHFNLRTDHVVAAKPCIVWKSEFQKTSHHQS